MLIAVEHDMQNGDNKVMQFKFLSGNLFWLYTMAAFVNFCPKSIWDLNFRIQLVRNQKRK